LAVPISIPSSQPASALCATRAPKPKVFISDQEIALKSTVQELLPNTAQLLCVWHINKNVLNKAQRVWRNADGNTEEEKKAISQQRAQFMSRWSQVCTIIIIRGVQDLYK
jgi:transposase-like protein